MLSDRTERLFIFPVEMAGDVLFSVAYVSSFVCYLAIDITGKRLNL